MMLIKNAYLVTGDTFGEGIGDILIRDGMIEEVAAHIDAHGAEELDAAGLTATPGLIDLHVHLRDPGQTQKEDIGTGTAAAAAGGVTTVVAMPNTTPPVCRPEDVAYILETAADRPVRVLPAACITKDMAGVKLTDFSALKEAGAVAVTDDGRPVSDSALMLAALRAARTLDLPVFSHAEELSLAAGGLMNEGEISRALNVKGTPAAAEDIAVARECMLSLYEQLPLHICHVSTRYAVEVIRMAKRLGAPLTCETAPHYFAFDETALLARDADFRMNPPLRTAADVESIKQGLADGTIDAIATDHAPHTPTEKAGFDRAPNGVIGVETSLGAGLTHLVRPGVLPLSRLIELMSTTPASIIKRPALGRLAKGAAADIVLLDPMTEWTVAPEALHGKSHNTPFKHQTLFGRVLFTLKNGEAVYHQERN